MPYLRTYDIMPYYDVRRSLRKESEKVQNDINLLSYRMKDKLNFGGKSDVSKRDTVSHKPTSSRGKLYSKHTNHNYCFESGFLEFCI